LEGDLRPDTSAGEFGERGIFFKCSGAATLFSTKDSPVDKTDVSLRENNNTDNLRVKIQEMGPADEKRKKHSKTAITALRL